MHDWLALTQLTVHLYRVNYIYLYIFTINKGNTKQKTV